MAEHSIEEIKRHIRTYYIVFGALAVLTTLTVAVAEIHLEIAEAVLVALGIALVKGSLVCLIFMHLKGEKKIIVYTLLLCFVLFIPLMALPILTDHDAMTKRIHPVDLRGHAGAVHDGEAHSEGEH